MILCMKLQQHKDLKLIFENFFGDNGSKMRFFQLLSKVNKWNFSDILHGVTATESLEMNRNEVFQVL